MTEGDRETVEVTGEREVVHVRAARAEEGPTAAPAPASGSPLPAGLKRKKKGSHPLMNFVTIFSFVFMFFILFNEDLRLATGRAVGVVLEPTITSHGQDPIWTIFLAGLVMVTLTTVVRHFFVDWVDMARAQEAMRAFQKAFREAQKEN
ncbi:MAG: hypothetical protein ACT4PT_05550, partial [Methanobacteriota archaeon]